MSEIVAKIENLVEQEGWQRMQLVADGLRAAADWREEENPDLGVKLAFGFYLRELASRRDLSEEVTPALVRLWNQEIRNYGVSGFGYDGIQAALRDPSSSNLLNQIIEGLPYLKGAQTDEHEYKKLLWEHGLRHALDNLDRIYEAWNLNSLDKEQAIALAHAEGEVAIRYLNLSWIKGGDSALIDKAKKFAALGWERVQGLDLEFKDYARARDNFFRLLSPEEQVEHVSVITDNLQRLEAREPTKAEMHAMGLDSYSIVSAWIGYLDDKPVKSWKERENIGLAQAFQFIDKGVKWSREAGNTHGERFLEELRPELVALSTDAKLQRLVDSKTDRKLLKLFARDFALLAIRDNCASFRLKEIFAKYSLHEAARLIEKNEA